MIWSTTTGNFTPFLFHAGIKSSQVVPDGLVYTEVKKTLVQGVQGVLTCRFFGKPIAVYWRKGLNLLDLSPMIVWSDGEVYGPRFDDGSCDVDENYSLIINNVLTADVGRIYCTVSNNKGPLMHNYTDISVVGGLFSIFLLFSNIFCYTYSLTKLFHHPFSSTTYFTYSNSSYTRAWFVTKQYVAQTIWIIFYKNNLK